MSAHTPAPWVIEADSGMSASYHMRRAVITSAEHEANARLIQVAPEMLQALRLYVEWCEAEDDHKKADFYRRMEMCRDAEQAARAAIAKATGSAA